MQWKGKKSGCILFKENVFVWVNEGNSRSIHVLCLALLLSYNSMWMHGFSVVQSCSYTAWKTMAIFNLQMYTNTLSSCSTLSARRIEDWINNFPFSTVPMMSGLRFVSFFSLSFSRFDVYAAHFCAKTTRFCLPTEKGKKRHSNRTNERKNFTREFDWFVQCLQVLERRTEIRQVHETLLWKHEPRIVVMRVCTVDDGKNYRLRRHSNGFSMEFHNGKKEEQWKNIWFPISDR